MPEEKEKKKQPRKAKPYVRMGERANRGELDLVVPLDYIILEQCPAEGSIALGVYPEATTVREMNSKMPKGLPKSLVTSRVRSLNIQGLLTQVRTPKSDHGTGSRSGNTLTAGWQITERGQGVLKKWKEEQSNGSA